VRHHLLLFLHDLAAPAESAAFIFIFRRIHTALRSLSRDARHASTLPGPARRAKSSRYSRELHDLSAAWAKRGPRRVFVREFGRYVADYSRDL
jgi:hypothetical protein